MSAGVKSVPMDRNPHPYGNGNMFFSFFLFAVIEDSSFKVLVPDFIRQQVQSKKKKKWPKVIALSKTSTDHKKIHRNTT